MWKFPGQGLNLHHSSDLSDSRDNFRSLTCWATREHILLIFQHKNIKTSPNLCFHLNECSQISKCEGDSLWLSVFSQGLSIAYYFLVCTPIHIQSNWNPGGHALKQSMLPFGAHGHQVSLTKCPFPTVSSNMNDTDNAPGNTLWKTVGTFSSLELKVCNMVDDIIVKGTITFLPFFYSKHFIFQINLMMKTFILESTSIFSPNTQVYAWEMNVSSIYLILLRSKKKRRRKCLLTETLQKI